MDNAIVKNIKIYTWEEIDKINRLIIKSITISCYYPDIVIGILRSGMVPAVHIAYLLGIDNVGSIFIRSTIDEKINSKKRTIPIVRFDNETNNVENKNVLVVDSVTATGNTFNCAINEIVKYNPKQIRTCAININPIAAKAILINEKPTIDFYGEEVLSWVYYPWEH